MTYLLVITPVAVTPVSIVAMEAGTVFTRVQRTDSGSGALETGLAVARILRPGIADAVCCATGVRTDKRRTRLPSHAHKMIASQVLTPTAPVRAWFEAPKSPSR